MPIDKWNMKIYKHIKILKEQSMANKFTGFFNSNQGELPVDYFITITGDGILKSDNHLLESRIQMMIPFTNQLTISCMEDKERRITYVIQACSH